MSTTDDLRELLDEWKTLARRAAAPIPAAVGLQAQALVDARAAARRDAAHVVPRLVAAVEAVLAEHHLETEYTLSDACAYGECGHKDECPVSSTDVCGHYYPMELLGYPCPTLAAVRAALTGDDND